MCLSVDPPSSNANLENTEAMAAKNPAATARENPAPNIPTRMRRRKFLPVECGWLHCLHLCTHFQLEKDM